MKEQSFDKIILNVNKIVNNINIKASFENWNKDKLYDELNLLLIELSDNICRNLINWECNYNTMWTRNNYNESSYKNNLYFKDNNAEKILWIHFGLWLV